MKNAEKTALVAGATGVVGRELVRRLCEHESYARVVVWARRKLEFSHAKLEARVINFDEIAQIEPQKFDEIYCALGTTIKQAKSRENFEKVDLIYVRELALWGARAGADKFSLVSAPNANAASGNFYLNVKGRAENAVLGVKFKSTLICRPPLIDGERDDVRTGERLGIWLFKFIPKNWFSDYRPMSGADIAKAMIKAAQAADIGVKIYRPQDVEI